jgi:hypothetical protein
MKPREIDVHIEELVLHGFARAARDLIGAELERTLSTLLVERGLPPSWQRNPERIDACTVHRNPPMPPVTTGEHIAHAIHGAPSG